MFQQNVFTIATHALAACRLAEWIILEQDWLPMQGGVCSPVPSISPFH
jgi:hypothetical protein